MQRFEEETFGCRGIPCWTQEELDRVPCGIDGSREIHPLFFDLDGRLIDFPGVIADFQMRSATLFQFRCILLNPTEDCGVIDRESALSHHLFQIAVAERISQVPTHAQQNDPGFKMTPLEWML